MTEFEIASAIQNYVTSHSGVTDSPFSLRQIRDEVDTLRLRLLDELFRQSNTIVDYTAYLQPLTISTATKDNKPYVEIPALYFTPGGKLAISFLGSSTQETPFKVVSGNRRLYAKHDLYTGKSPTAIYMEGKITFENVAPKSIFIEGVFNKPSQLSPYGYDWKTSQYPVPYGVIDMIIGKTAESYLRLLRPVMPVPNTQSDETDNEITQLRQT